MEDPNDYRDGGLIYGIISGFLIYAIIGSFTYWWFS